MRALKMLGPVLPTPRIPLFAVRAASEALQGEPTFVTGGERRNYCGLNRVSANVYVVRTRVTYLIIRNVALELRA